MRQLLILTAMMSLGANAQLACEGNLFVNGDLDGSEGEDTTAPGWEAAVYTPDLNDENGPLNSTVNFEWFGIPLASPTGGTWQNLCPPEALSQQVQTVPGVVYTVCFYYAQQPIQTIDGGNVWNGDFGVDVSANSELFLQVPSSGENYVWQRSCGSFVASSSSATLLFQGTTSSLSCGAIDGLCMLSATHNDVGETNSKRIGLFPNPAIDQVRVYGSHAVLKATATHAIGQTVDLPVLGDNIDISSLKPGMHIVRCWYNDGGPPLQERLMVQG